MDKNELVKLLSELFIPLGFKKKGNYWILKGDVVSKLINLQRSYYSKTYYINYGFILNKLPLTTMTHLDGRLASSDKVENKRIHDLLYLENTIDQQDRLSELRHFMKTLMIPKLLAINTESEFLDKVKRSPYSSMIPLVVKEYFGLKEW